MPQGSSTGSSFCILPHGDQWIDINAAQPGFWPDPNGVFLAGINNSEDVRRLVG
jgi:hypothetical protein